MSLSERAVILRKGDGDQDPPHFEEESIDKQVSAIRLRQASKKDNHFEIGMHANDKV